MRKLTYIIAVPTVFAFIWGNVAMAGYQQASPELQDEVRAGGLLKETNNVCFL